MAVGHLFLVQKATRDGYSNDPPGSLAVLISNRKSEKILFQAIFFGHIEYVWCGFRLIIIEHF